MSSIRIFLTKNPLASADTQLKLRESLDSFSQFLPENVGDIWPRVLHRFASTRPWKYWDPEAVRKALEILEGSPDRTISAVSTWSRQISIGFENIFRLSPITKQEGNITDSGARNLLRLSTEYHPEYLRYVEHIFGNLLKPYWAVLKKGAVEGSFDLRKAESAVKSKGCDFLLSGYVDRIRNAIAHGEVSFASLGIQYGLKSNFGLSFSEFLREFDALIRTSNVLALTLLIFLARNQRFLSSKQSFSLPSTIITLIAGASVERPGLKVVGAVESDLAQGKGKQLHISLESYFKSREVLFLESTRLAMHLLESGVPNFSRYLFEIDCGEKVSSLVDISPEKLSSLLRQDASIDHLPEAFGETQCLWFDESRIRRLIKTWRIIFPSHLRLAKENFWINMKNAGLSLTKGRYEIREVENVSVDGVPKTKAIAVLKFPSDAEDRTLVKRIVRSIIKELSHRWINSNAGNIEKSWGFPRRPKYISVSLYRLDGTVRWLRSGGWPEGNLIVVAEKINGSRRKPIFVPNAQEIWNGIRFRYSMDVEEAAQAFSKLAEFMSQFQEEDSSR